MARPPKPTAMDAERFEHDPQRLKAREFEPRTTGPFGDPPARLDLLERDMWLELEGQVPQNVLMNADRLAFEVLVKLLTRCLLKNEPMKAAEISQINAGLGRLGMTPSDRAKLSVPKPANDPSDEFTRLAREAGRAGITKPGIA